MSLTDPQKATLKTFIETDPALSLYQPSAQSAFDIALALQAIAAPEFIVWKSSVTQDEIMQNGFDWTRVDNLGVGKARVWEWMFNNQDRAFNPSKINVRAGIDAVWVGTAADLAVRAAVYVHCKRPANILEKVLATGTGTTEAPATMGYEGSISYNEVGSVMGWSF